MNILTVENITKSYGVRKLFDQESFFLEEGEKVGVIGINGTGKSTLLKIIAGLEEPDEGNVIKAKNYMVRYLPQNPEFGEKETVIEAVLRDNIVSEHEKAIEMEITADAKAMLTQLGVRDFEQPCGELSGGQKKRLALVSVLLSSAEILVLDEPTNHLDNEMADWLEETLQKRRGAVVMVTHDRYFLDTVSTRIIEIDKGHIYSYDANYSGYLELKMQREEMEEASARKRDSILRKELAWVQRGARARSTKQKARLERFEDLKNEKGPIKDGQVALSSMASRLGKTTVELTDISKSYGKKVLFQNFSYIFLKNDRVGFIGQNGSGKSTLMKIIIGEIEPDKGSLEIGQTVKIGYYSQEISDDMMNPNQRVIDYVKEVAEYIDTQDGTVSAAKMLERFLFEGEDQYSLLGKLSGGERRRLRLLRVLMEAPNVLIMDEPTNDLDITTLRVLEDYLDDFQGIVVVVSHDRYFLDRIVNRIFALENEQFVQYEGGYSDYANRKQEEAILTTTEQNINSNEQNKTSEQNSKNWKSGQWKKLKFTYQEQKDYETIENEIASMEEEIESLEGMIPQYVTDFVKLNDITTKKEALKEELDQRIDYWMHLEELAARIEAGEMIENQ